MQRCRHTHCVIGREEQRFVPHKTRHDKTRYKTNTRQKTHKTHKTQDKTRHKTRQDTRQRQGQDKDKTRTRQVKTRQDKTRQDKTWERVNLATPVRGAASFLKIFLYLLL